MNALCISNRFFLSKTNLGGTSKLTRKWHRRDLMAMWKLFWLPWKELPKWWKASSTLGLQTRLMTGKQLLATVPFWQLKEKQTNAMVANQSLPRGQNLHLKKCHVTKTGSLWLIFVLQTVVYRHCILSRLLLTFWLIESCSLNCKHRFCIYATVLDQLTSLHTIDWKILQNCSLPLCINNQYQCLPNPYMYNILSINREDTYFVSDLQDNLYFMCISYKPYTKIVQQIYEENNEP